MRSGGRASQQGAHAGKAQEDPETMHKVENDGSFQHIGGPVQESKVKHAQPHQRQLLRGVVRRNAAKIQVDKDHALLRHRRLEVVDKVNDNKTPSNVSDEPRRRARSNARDRTIGGLCAGVAP